MIKCEETAIESEKTIAELVRVWDSSVRATHLFLPESEIDRIRGCVPQALRQVQHLIVATEDGVPVAFAGVDGCKLEMLFVAAENRGRGIGAKLLRYAIERFAPSERKELMEKPKYQRNGLRRTTGKVDITNV